MNRSEQWHKQLLKHLELLDDCNISSAGVSINSLVDVVSTAWEQEDIHKYQRTLRTFEYEGVCGVHKFKLIMEEV